DGQKAVVDVVVERPAQHGAAVVGGIPGRLQVRGEGGGVGDQVVLVVPGAGHVEGQPRGEGQVAGGLEGVGDEVEGAPGGDVRVEPVAVADAVVVLGVGGAGLLLPDRIAVRDAEDGVAGGGVG